MLFSPTLIVTRVVILRNERPVYDERYHRGVNVLRGENSSGKSTVLNFIFYGLGGDLADWSEVALLCDRVFLEVELNGRNATLSRSVSKQFGQPMEIFGGPYEASLIAPQSAWTRYPYRRSANLESFSQALFRLLDIPEANSDVSGNITMHQILRLIYADQLSPVENIFRYEPRFDQPALRDTIARLLCGGYDSNLYERELQIREVGKQLENISGELRSLFAVMGRFEHSLTLDWIAERRRVLERQQQELRSAIEEADRELFLAAADDQLTLQGQDDAYNEVQRLQEDIAAAEKRRDGLILAIADSEMYIRSLESKLRALTDSSLVCDFVGEISFNSCPACYAPVAKDGDPVERVCYLCKTPFSAGHAKERMVAMINDVALQLKQSRILQEARASQELKLRSRVEELRDLWQHASNRFSALQRLPSTEAQQRIGDLNRQAGYVEREFDDLKEKAAVIEMIDQASKRKAQLNENLSRLETEVKRLRISQEDRLAKACTLISDEIKFLLKNDLRRQDAFEDPRSIQIDFRDNKVSVDGHSYFSASSRVILKSSVFLGFFAASTKDAIFRFPRFVIIDTVEDKGMEPARSHNFQNLILKVSQTAMVDHQVIYATSMIAPDLSAGEFTIGGFYTRDRPTLQISSRVVE